uniref:Dolichyl-diphosphooligosaccharide--protein glycosyltransferase subunit 1 n=1 Tax=Equus asinus TaxID=9793 RepID=A0A9L0ITK3_EQUAS
MEASATRLLMLPLLLLGAWAPAPGGASPEAPPLVNEDVKRTVDLSSHLAKVTAEVVLAHPGGGSAPRATSFLLALEPELEARLAHLGVQVKGEDEEENNLEVRETKIKGKSCGTWDAASAWFDEQCHVRAQDSNQRNTGPPAAEPANLSTRPRGQPQDIFQIHKKQDELHKEP